MRIKLLLFISIFLFNVSYSQVGNSPYPIIFVHGINSSEETWDGAITRLQQAWQVSFNRNLNFVLNALGGNTNYLEDVIIPLYDENGNTVNKLTNSNIYTINFKNFWNENINDPRIIIHSNEGPGTFITESKSNESSIYKQGFALRILIDSVLKVTGAEKVILVGHSMGGLAIREYLQRKENGIHKWWINPSGDINGHKVAKVLTMSTPHLGSNAPFVYIFGINQWSEAMRDIRYFYESQENSAPYLFSNYEFNVLGYHNNDVNCNGSTSDYIEGISYGTSYHSSVYPLPININYTWLVSKFTKTGDGCVDLDRQWLYNQNNQIRIAEPINISDTIMTNKRHDLVTDDIISIIRGLDEPGTKEFAYNISLGKHYSGFITSQSNGLELDLDFYKVTTTKAGNLVVNLNALNSGVTDIALLASDGTLLISKPVTNASESISYEGPPNDYYIRIKGYSYNNPNYNNYLYSINLTTSQVNGEESLSSKIEYFCKECDYKLFKSDDFKRTVKDSKSNSYEINIYEKQSGYFCKVTNLQSITNSIFQIEGQWMLDIGYVKLDNSSSNILIITGIGGSGGAGKIFNLINLENMKLITFSYLKMGQQLPDVTRSKNFFDLNIESDFIEKLKYEYGYIDEEYIKKNTNNPNLLMEVWRFYNNEINNGKITIFTYQEIPKYFNDAGEHSKLETDEMIFTAYHKSGVIAYNKTDKTYFVIFVPKDSYSWIQTIEKYKNYLLLGTGLEGLAIINLNSLVLKRIDLGKNYNDVKNISVNKDQILINGKKTIEFKEF